jgi:hypothetical protein
MGGSVISRWERVGGERRSSRPMTLQSGALPHGDGTAGLAREPPRTRASSCPYAGAVAEPEAVGKRGHEEEAHGRIVKCAGEGGKSAAMCGDG